MRGTDLLRNVQRDYQMWAPKKKGGERAPGRTVGSKEENSRKENRQGGHHYKQSRRTDMEHAGIIVPDGTEMVRGEAYVLELRPILFAVRE